MKLARKSLSYLLLAMTFSLVACGENDAPEPVSQSSFERDSDNAIGSAQASLTIVEYASVACGACAHFHEAVWPMMESDYIETGQVRFVFREMLAGNPQFAMAGFALANCVSEDRYFDMIDLLFQQQPAIFQAARQPGGARSQYLAIAQSMGMNESDFNACLANEDVQNQISNNSQQANREGIEVTPTFLFNGELLSVERTQGSSVQTYHLGNRQIIVEGDPVPYQVDEATFRTLIEYALSIAETSASAGEPSENLVGEE